MTLDDLDKHLVAIGKLRVRDLSAEHADNYVIAHAELGKKTVANHLTLLVSTLNVGRDLGWLDLVPRIHKPRVRMHGKDFAYLRSPDDIRRFLGAAAAESEGALAMFATGVFTGARAGELAAFMWSDIDFDRRLITIQRSFDGPTKADDVRHVPILDPLLPILRAWRLRNPLALVFPNQAGTMHGESSRIFQEVFHRVLKAAGFPTRRTKAGNERGHIRFHDLRHTFASHWAMGGGDMFRLQRILGHKSIAMTMRYAHLAPDAFTQDFGRLGGAAPTTLATVIPLRRSE